MRLFIVFVGLTSFLGQFLAQAQARPIDSLFLVSEEKSIGSMFGSKMGVYTKTFDVTMSNLSNMNVNLSLICFEGYASDGRMLELDTIDDNLVTGLLPPQKQIKGKVVFVSQKEDLISGATIVKVSDSCD
ncbi:DUF4354 family protein [Vibrio mediterranei]|uniref:DUF4354 family protein n=1 Tax=Vibrio mediterranei TaxID=689 RepID=UPI00148B8FE3|nr:DUF4354 family protein [Vibrio mediterranei]NOI26380.1 DUF4354 family protein [Vibrio mediterranei]